MYRFLILFLGALALSSPGMAYASSIVDLTVTHAIKPNVVYQTADGMELKLDIYAPINNIWGEADKKKPVPTIVLFHGGGWMWGAKDSVAIHLMPYLEKGWAAVAVQYRLGGTALAPAAVEDARCAVWWVKRHAKEFGFDPERIVLTGRSAGGHLALIAGMLPATANFDARCPEQSSNSDADRLGGKLPDLEVAAIIDWAGITDVADLIDGPNMKSYAVMWLGMQDNREAIAQRVSPINHVRKNVPPILILHGDQDKVVPYAHAVRLHQALNAAGATSKLHTLAGREHFADFTVEDTRKAFEVINAFLEEHVGQ